MKLFEIISAFIFQTTDEITIWVKLHIKFISWIVSFLVSTRWPYLSHVFVVNAEIIANTFMEEVALSFGMTAVIVVDADRKFRSTFEGMCTGQKKTSGH